MIIKAGTYLVNEVPDLSVGFNQWIDFYSDGYFSSNVKMSSIQIDLSGNAMSYLDTDYGGYIDVYTSDGGWKEYASRTITVPKDTEVDDTAGTWFTESTTMLIKAGTYKWNDVIETGYSAGNDDTYELPFYFEGDLTDASAVFYCSAITIGVDGAGDFINYYCSHAILSDGTQQSFNDVLFGVYYESTGGWGSIPSSYKQGFGQIITITEDTYVPTAFGLWGSENWREYVEETSTPAVEITYKDKVVTLEAGQTARLHNADGSSFGFEEDLVIKANAGGSCSGNHIIEVSKLPTENIDEKATYWDGKSYYKYSDKFKDVIAVQNYTAQSLVDAYTQFGVALELYYVKARPTENIKVTSAETEMYLYYVEDENDVLLYVSGELTGSDTTDWMSITTLMGIANGGAITDISQATGNDTMYALVDNGWKAYGNPCVIEADKLPTENIDENAVYKVGESYYDWANEWKEYFSAEFNIAYGTTEPTDTSKLWVKTSEPDTVKVVSNVESTGEGTKLGVAILSATLPKKTVSIASGVVGTKVYLFGGQGGSSGGYLNTINVFDTETNTITTLSATLSTETTCITSGVVGTKVYLFGGLNSSIGHLNTINVFDTETNTITTLSTKLPTAARNMASGVVGTKVYLFGGVSSSGRLNTINVFDTETNTITTLSTKLPTAAYEITSGVVGTKVYLFGGYSGGFSNTINVFDTETNTITTLSTKLPTVASGIASGVVGTKVYLFGGSGGNSYHNTINVFDTETNTITTLSATLPTGATNIASGVVGTKVYLFGGQYMAGSYYINTINVFTTLLALATNNMFIEASIAKNIFNLLPTVEIGVNAVYLGNADGVPETVAAALYVDGAWTEI